MKALELIQWALEFTEAGLTRLVSDMRDRPLTQPTSAGGNHPLWVLGHLAYSEGFASEILFGEPNPLQHWAKLFAPGSQPTTNPADYPSFDELLNTFREMRAKNLVRLKEIGEAGLDAKPENVPEPFKDVMTSVGKTYLLLALHQNVHYGEVCDARRVAGLKPLM
ncbi:DinB superfamily protein [Caulifigura coniformis]|uniref:DinB superfamily protein n=1 Tax=Caulifigura coniformis TaxID=2527983 RepID=A0A517SDN9_9PLAN|nr:DinB family protein [Caulifigura coniformis]QDT54242.1 DinB superfamily protein [Caulifigura coniformis]